jgi:RNA polymerase sigma factor (sigma-70 family)
MLTYPDIGCLNTDDTSLIKDSIEDEVLWAKLKSGNELAFSLLYKRYVNRLFNYGMHNCTDRELIKDCLQELFVRLWTRRETLGNAASVNFYLFKSFRRLLIGRLVASRQFTVLIQGKPAGIKEFIPPVEDDITEGEAQRQQLKILFASINDLTKRQREAIILKYFSELSYHEISSIMELRVDSVYNLISKALDILRIKLKFSSFQQ